MRAGTKAIAVIATGTISLATIVVLEARAGDLDAPAAPNDPASAMFTLEDVYHRIDNGAAGFKRAGAFVEPSSGPGSTGHTLDQLYQLASERSRPAKTGQTTSYAVGDDGDVEKGVVWPAPRFIDNGDGTVTDNLTGLLWLQAANCFGAQNWTAALTTVNALANGGCGLSDGSSAGDWRLPNAKELTSLIDYSQSGPALSPGHPFSGVQLNFYWSSSTYALSTSEAWNVFLNDGRRLFSNKGNAHYIWAVRGGQ